MTMATVEAVLPKTTGGAFLIEETEPSQVFTLEDLSEEHLAIGKTAEEFFNKEVQPNLEAIVHMEPGLALKLLRKSAELGLTAIAIPEKFGGMELDLASALIAAEHLGKDPSYGGWHGAHTGIGTLPVLYFGTEAQKQKYLPRLAKVDLLAAYALTEPHAGSDAQAARTRADLSADGTHYLLNGQKMWITNGGAADVFIVFAKIGGGKFTAFIVERAFGGVTSGKEEAKMGIKGSSTTAVYFENVKVPVENVLGEIGRGHIIAFNILNVGRLKLGALTAAGAKRILGVCLKYAKDRKAFGATIGDFGAIQHKLAEMAIRIYAADSMAWRVVGNIQSRLGDFSWQQPDASQTMLKAVEEFAVECSMIKVYGSEVLDYAADEGVQIHGGYGFHQEYAVERSYRDSRINRIFEGTNEINRLLITGMLVKRASRGQLGLVPAAMALQAEIQSGKIGSAETDEELRLVKNAKNLAVFSLGLAFQKYQSALEKQQEVMMNISDIVMETFAMESTLLRTRKAVAAGKVTIAAEMCSVFLRDAMGRIEQSARNVLGACSDGDGLRKNMGVLRRLAMYDPLDAVALRRKIASRLLARERYVV
jgi:alkylation response protein AidB-like acyl-CoA dehydrogenase